MEFSPLSLRKQIFMSEFSEGRRQIPEPEQITIDHDKFRKAAKRLFDAHMEEIMTEAPHRFVHTKIEEVLRQFPSDVMKKYWGHGVTKGELENQLAAALSIIENRVMQGSTAPISGSGYADAYTNGSFFIISRKDGSSIIKGMKDRMPERVKFTNVNGNETIGLRVDPGAFVFNNVFDSVVEEVKQMYPDARILHAEELADYIREQETSEE